MVEHDHTAHRETPWHTARSIPSEFEQQAVQLAQQPGNTNQSIARDLGISQSALRRWIKAAIERPAREPVTLRQERATRTSAAIWSAREAR